MMDYGGKYLKIRKAVHEAGFDEFYQAGSVNRFRKMNIVAESAVLSMRFWICIDGGYGVRDEFYIVRRKLPENSPDERTYYNSQEEMATAIGDIGKEIRAANKEEITVEGMTVNTPLGMLVVKSSTDPENPGIYIDLHRPGCDCDAPVAMVEVTSDESDQRCKPTLITRTWDNVNEEDYRTRVVHTGIEEYFGEEGI